uniref:Uncharacterized protein n=1 Tax=Oryza nivara TaxID=4536 RepID=A0A0E0FIE9_ORYNI
MTSPPPIHHEQTPHHVPDYQLAPPLPSRAKAKEATNPAARPGRTRLPLEPDTAVARARNARRSQLRLTVDNNSLRRYLEYLPSTVKDLYSVQASAVCR